MSIDFTVTVVTTKKLDVKVIDNKCYICNNINDHLDFQDILCKNNITYIHHPFDKDSVPISVLIELFEAIKDNKKIGFLNIYNMENYYRSLSKLQYITKDYKVVEYDTGISVAVALALNLSNEDLCDYYENYICRRILSNREDPLNFTTTISFNRFITCEWYKCDVYTLVTYIAKEKFLKYYQVSYEYRYDGPYKFTFKNEDKYNRILERYSRYYIPQLLEKYLDITIKNGVILHFDNPLIKMEYICTDSIIKKYSITSSGTEIIIKSVNN